MEKGEQGLGIGKAGACFGTWKRMAVVPYNPCKLGHMVFLELRGQNWTIQVGMRLKVVAVDKCMSSGQWWS